jgi:hypothetical protein
MKTRDIRRDVLLWAVHHCHRGEAGTERRAEESGPGEGL